MEGSWRVETLALHAGNMIHPEIMTIISILSDLKDDSARQQTCFARNRRFAMRNDG